ncbi:MAG: hypothetical protein ACI9HK_006132, partial [Pirellulaceae bacterium]
MIHSLTNFVAQRMNTAMRLNTALCLIGTLRVIATLCFIASPATSLYADDLDEFRVNREAVFEFTEKPTIARGDNQFIIQFASKANCDVSVAIEDGDGKIVRHLASGVLGPTAPPPLQKNSTSQRIVWDGKSDRDV